MLFIEVLKEIQARLFTSGVPVISTSAISENEFLYSGNLMAASLLQGGPPPCFLKKWVYDYIVYGLCEKLDISCEDLPSLKVKNFVNMVKYT